VTGALIIIGLVAAYLLAHLFLLRDTRNLNLPKKRPGDSPPKPSSWDDEED
jgi:hypothetical protein